MSHTAPDFAESNSDVSKHHSHSQEASSTLYSNSLTTSKVSEGMDQLGERSIVVEPPSYGVLGTLWLVGRKTGLDMQSFPIDAERVTIGR